MSFAICDGSSIRNPGPGGWAYAIQLDQAIRVCYGFSPNATNNQMELQAVLEAVKNAKGIKEIYTDSKYLVDGMSRWIHKWKLNGWRTTAKQPVLNSDLWREIDSAISSETKIHWLPGHATYTNFTEPVQRLKIWIQNKVDFYANQAARESLTGHIDIPITLLPEEFLALFSPENII